MAIFKKLLASDSTTNKKTNIGSSPPSVSSAFSTFPRSHSFNVQPQQQQRQTIAAFDGRQSANGMPKGQRTTQQKNGTCSATKTTTPSSSPPTATAASCSTTAEGEGLLDGIEDLCKCLYNQTLRREKIRLAVFSEKDRRLLYDSETIVAVNDRLVVGSHRSQCGRFQFLPHKDDKLDIAKMLFGTFPSAITMESLKIHTLSDINYVMVSRIFSVPRLTKYYVNATTTNPFKSNDIYKCTVGSLSSDSDNQSNYSTIRSLEGIQDRHREVDHPLIVNHHQQQQQFSHHSCARFPLSFSRNSATSSEPPERFNRVRNSSLQLETNDVEDIMEMEELRAFSPNRLSRTRRRQLSQLGLDDALSLRLSNRSRLSSCSSIADACALGDSSAEWKQYGFALILPSEFRSFIFLHILQIERELDRLILQIHKAVQDRAQFLQLIYEGWSSLCVSLCLLCNSPRLRSPVWLSLVSADLDMKGPIAADFCSNLSRLIRLLNTKETKFLFSTAISAVLMNQLAWIASVAPPDKCSGNAYRPLLFGASSIDPRQMPYNPAVAQWLELHSGIGIANDEPKFVKIVVVGQNRRLVATMLNVLSYFVRCSSVESRREKIMMGNHLLFSEQQPLYDFGRSLFAGIVALIRPILCSQALIPPKVPLTTFCPPFTRMCAIRWASRAPTVKCFCHCRPVPPKRFHRRSPLLLCFDQSHFSALVAMRQSISTTLQVIPITDKNRNLLPVHFSVDPGPDFTWWRDNDDFRIAHKIEAIQSDDRRLELISRYMDIVRLDLRRGSVRKTVPMPLLAATNGGRANFEDGTLRSNGGCGPDAVACSSYMLPPVPNKLLTLAAGGVPSSSVSDCAAAAARAGSSSSGSSASSSILKEIRQHFRRLGRKLSLLSSRRHTQQQQQQYHQPRCSLPTAMEEETQHNQQQRMMMRDEVDGWATTAAKPEQHQQQYSNNCGSNSNNHHHQYQQNGTNSGNSNKKGHHRSHSTTPFAAAELLQDNHVVLTVLLHNYAHQYIDSMLTLYIAKAKERFERAKMMPHSALPPLPKNRLSRSFSTASVLLTCLSAHCQRVAQPSNNFLCDACFAAQKRELTRTLIGGSGAANAALAAASSAANISAATTGSGGGGGGNNKGTAIILIRANDDDDNEQKRSGGRKNNAIKNESSISTSNSHRSHCDISTIC